MKENVHDSTVPGQDECVAVIRRHTHDVRNGLNGFELEASLLEAIHGDEKTQEGLRRMRRQVGLIDLALRSLITRFVEPDRRVVPVRDVFTLWRSRSKKLSHFDAVEWTCHAEGALMLVDASMVADALCENLGYLKGSRIAASVRKEGHEILFEICRGAESPEASYFPGNVWPLLDLVILRNGGRHDAGMENGLALSRKCWFPASPLAPGSDETFPG